ncbi:hypothetical protein Slin14017_G076030 [Septoria linicola]|nr:hypothetical protein Slin14017_G076030 [Septoria linicola]
MPAPKRKRAQVPNACTSCRNAKLMLWEPSYLHEMRGEGQRMLVRCHRGLDEATAAAARSLSTN